MTSRILFSLIVLTLSVTAQQAAVAETEPNAEKIVVAATDWPWWRGPNRNGVAAADQTPPVEWDAKKNILWKTPVPGRGHGSPIIVGDRVFLATADEEKETQSVLCFDRNTGKQLWKTELHQGGFESTGRQGNQKSTKASSTIACDGERLFINFPNHDAVFINALSMDGEKLWQKKITDYVMHQGYGSSPAIYGPLVIVSADNKGGGVIAAYNRTNGDLVWQQDRPKLPNYPSPIILPVAGRDQLLFTGCNLVSSFDPLTGKKSWEIEGATTECVTSTVSDGEYVVSSGGYPDNHISAVRGDGSGEVVWRNKIRVYVPSLLVHEGHLYGVTDAGIAICYELATGKRIWRQRLGAKFTASPVLVGDQIYAVSEDGRTFIFNASVDGYKSIGENKLADEVIATPAICGGRIYIRGAEMIDDRRQEMLYCIGTAQ